MAELERLPNDEDKQEEINQQLEDKELTALGMPDDHHKVFELINNAEFMLASYVEDRPHLAPSSQKNWISKKKVWRWDPKFNQWVSVPFSLSIDACRLFEAAFFEHGLQNMYVKAIMQLLKKAIIADESDDDEETCNNHFFYNIAVMMNAQAVTRVIAGGHIMQMREKEFEEGMSEIIKF